MSKIETGKYSDLLRRALGMKGVSDVASELSPEVSPTWEIERDALEWGFLKKVRHIAVGATVVPGAAAIALMRLRNPPGSGALVVVDYSEMNPSAASLANIVFSPTIAQAVLPTVVTAGAVDGRWGFERSTAVLSTGTGATLGSFILLNTLGLSGTPIQYEDQIVMPPNSSLDWGFPTLDIDMRLNVRWHERGVARLEL